MNQPIWKVLMPPLIFEASKPPAAQPSPETLLLVAEVRVVPAVIFNGRVAPRSTSGDASAGAVKKIGLGGKIKGFFRWLFGAKQSKT